MDSDDDVPDFSCLPLTKRQRLLPPPPPPARGALPKLTAPPGTVLSGRAVLRVPASEERQRLKTATTLQPTASASAKEVPAPLHMAVEDAAAGTIALPRQYFLARYSMDSVQDARALGTPLPDAVRASSKIKLTSTPPQVAALDATLEQLRGPLGAGQLVLPCGMGKCLAKGTLVLMADGSRKKVQDVTVGNMLMGDDAVPRRVLSINSGWDDALFRVLPVGAGSSMVEPYVVNSAHILTLWDARLGQLFDISLKDALRLSPEQLRGASMAVTWPYKAAPEPYNAGVRATRSRQRLLMIYKANTVDVRVQTLRGIIDGMGQPYDEGDTRSVQLVFDNGFVDDILLEDVKFLARSLGLRFSMPEPRRVCFGKELAALAPTVLTVATRVSPPAAGRLGSCRRFMCGSSGSTWERVAPEAVPLSPVLDYAVTISRVQAGRYYGFEIDGNRRFLLGDFTVTHNTVCGAHAILELGCKALVLVTDRGLMKQWANRFAHFVPGARVGFIQGKKAQWRDADVCIGMVQSFFKPNKYPAEMFAAFGTVVCDESHMMAAREMSKVVPLFPARHVLALSATPDRDDGCTDALHWLFGPVAFRCVRPWQEVRVEVARYGEALPDMERYGKPAHDMNVTRITEDPVRNAFIVGRALRAVASEGRHVMILSERTKHIMLLADMVARARPGTSVGLYHGELSDAERNVFLEKQYDVVISIMKMGKQGLDKPEVDMVIFGTPVMRKYEQAVGRALRPYPGKEVRVPTIVDIVDPYSAFAGMARVRSKFHAEQKYVMSRYAIAATADTADTADTTISTAPGAVSIGFTIT